jgi:hypothetical protein
MKVLLLLGVWGAGTFSSCAATEDAEKVFSRATSLLRPLNIKHQHRKRRQATHVGSYNFYPGRDVEIQPTHPIFL